MANREPRSRDFSPTAQTDTFEPAQGAEIPPSGRAILSNKANSDGPSELPSQVPGCRLRRACVKQSQFAAGRVVGMAHPPRLQAGASVQNKANSQKAK